jgi:hypothetical protein
MKTISDVFTFRHRYTIWGLIIYDTTDYIGLQTITVIFSIFNEEIVRENKNKIASHQDR